MKETGALPTGARWMLGFLIFGAVTIPLYWIVWFGVDRSWLAAANTPAYFAYENAFPAADGWLALASARGAWALGRRKPSALLWMLCAGSASLYLGAMDVLFDLENGIYRAPTGEWGNVAVEIAINLLTLGLGVAAMIYAWWQRSWLLGTGAKGGQSEADGAA